MNPRLKWLCRRGMKELDLLMESYLQQDYPQASNARQAAFEKLLGYQDPLILDLLFGRERDADAEVQALIDILRDYQVAKAGE